MSKKDDALKLAREALEHISSHYMSLPKIGCMALAAVEEALAERPAVQGEPVAYMNPEDLEKMKRFGRGSIAWATPTDFCTQPVYTTPQPAVPECKPLTDEEIWYLWERCSGTTFEIARAVEAAHGIKGEA